MKLHKGLILRKQIIAGILLAHLCSCVGISYANDVFKNNVVFKIDSAEIIFEQNKHSKHSHTLKNFSLENFTAENNREENESDDWRKVSLPYKPAISGNSSSGNSSPYIWFRMPLDHLDAHSLEAIYITHHAFDIEVYVDGYLIGEKKGPNDKYVMGWNTPLLFTIPEYIHEGPSKILHIKLRAAKYFTFLPEIYIGKLEPLQKRFDQRYFLQVKAAEWGWVASILLGIFSLFLWLKRSKDKQYLQFSLLCFSWSVVLLYMFLPYSPFSPQLWLKIAYLGADAAGIAMFFFINSMMGFQHRKLEIFLTCIMLIIIAIYFILPINKVFYLVSFAHFVVLFFTLYLLSKTIVIAVKGKHPTARTISIGVAWVGFFVAYDIFSFTLSYKRNIPLPDFTLMQHGFLFLLVTFFILLIHRFLAALDNSEDLNNTLEEKIDMISEELKKSYEASRLLEISKSSELQRQNIMRDLHDDIGAKLISITSSSNSKEQSELGREALISMKEIVSQSNSLSNDINSTVIIATTEMEARFESANISVVLMADKTLDEILVPPQTCYHLSRILREITTNIIKHSKATKVSIKYQFSDFLDYEIKDNGIGMDITNNVGNGLRNIQFRVNAIHGSLKMHSEQHPEQQNGLTIALRVPLQFH